MRPWRKYDNSTIPFFNALSVEQFLDGTISDGQIGRIGGIKLPAKSLDFSPLDLFMCIQLKFITSPSLNPEENTIIQQDGALFHYEFSGR